MFVDQITAPVRWDRSVATLVDSGCSAFVEVGPGRVLAGLTRFGGAPIINVLYAMIVSPPKAAPNPLLYVGFALASLGAGMVLYFRPAG